MRVFSQAVVLVASLLFGDSFVHAYFTNDASGHWQGSITMPFGELRLEVDLARDSQGKWQGTIAVPDQKLNGLPLTTVTVDGASVTFTVRGGRGGTFRGTLSADGRSLAGTASSSEGETVFALERSGEARIAPLPRSAPIARDLEGTWNGTLDAGVSMRVILRMANQADGTSTGSLVSVDEGNFEIPIAIAQDGAKLELKSPMIGSSYSGTLNPDRNELTGVYTTSQGIALPLTLRKQ